MPGEPVRDRAETSTTGRVPSRSGAVDSLSSCGTDKPSARPPGSFIGRTGGDDIRDLAASHNHEPQLTVSLPSTLVGLIAGGLISLRPRRHGWNEAGLGTTAAGRIAEPGSEPTKPSRRQAGKNVGQG
jgi:hypothetical protein